METSNGNKSGESLKGLVFWFDDFVIDPANRVLLRDGEDVPLTGKVFDVLLVFAENPGRLIEKDEMMEKVWHSNFVEEGNLARSVSSLRKALGDGSNGHKYIVTVQGRGYRFAANVVRLPSHSPSEDANGAIQDLETGGPIEILPPLAKKSGQNRKRTFLFIAGIALVLLVLGVGFWRPSFLPARLKFQSSPVDSIAVLPFENSTGNSDLDYLSHGITENIINALSPLPNLRVLPRSTVYAYNGKVQDPYSTGTSLGVRAVLTGKVVQREDTLTIQTELIDVDRRAQIWGQQYVYKLSDVSTIQRNIAEQVVNNLSLKLSPSQQQELTRRSTTNPDAQKAHMWGLYYFNQALNDPTQNAVGLNEKSIENLEQATKLDPNYVQAYADLARSYQSFQFISENGIKARHAAETALQLDETNPTAHSVLGLNLWQNDWDPAGAEREFRRAVELAPNEAHYDYAQLLSAECRHEESIREIKAAEELDPLNLQIKAWKGFIYKDARQYDLAIDQFNSVLQMDPNLINARFGLIEAYTLKGENDEAEAESQKLLKLSDRSDTQLFIGAMYAYMGRRDDAMRIYDRYKEPGHATNILMASIASSLGNNDDAFFWLEKGFRARGRFMLGIRSSPIFDRLHDDPRFADLMRRMGLPQ